MAISLDPDLMGSVQKASFLAQTGKKTHARRRKTGPKKKSELEETFWRDLGFAKIREGWKREYRFHETRRWAFDFALPAERLAVECEGVTREGGRHQRPEGFTEDCNKYNEAVVCDWRVLRFTRKHLIEDCSAIGTVRRALATAPVGGDSSAV